MNNGTKSPLGIPPAYMVERERIIDITRAISEYIQVGETGHFLEDWAKELLERIVKYNIERKEGMTIKI